ncbi:hypothetical protein R1sor_010541 [Riccia sorocarpa]|uniref:Uncharacterized protein n=1 Tax=Riccia sorocarpa TaxID=122646 RepID=A0ABD3HYB1_9MARC
MRVSARICERCDAELETPEHLWWNCTDVLTRKWQVLRLVGEGERNPAPDSLLAILDYVLSAEKMGSGKLKLATAEMEAEATLYKKDLVAEWSRNHKWLVAKVARETCSEEIEVDDESDGSQSITRSRTNPRIANRQEQNSEVEQRSWVPTDSRTSSIRRKQRREEDGMFSVQVAEATGRRTVEDTEHHQEEADVPVSGYPRLPVEG